MKRLAIAAAAGAVVLLVWSSISWMLIPWHRMGKFPGEEGIRQTLKLTKAPRGVYWIPGVDLSLDTSAMTDAEKQAMDDALDKAYDDGPIALVVYDPRGGPSTALMFIMGFILDFLVALVAAILLMIASPVLPGLPGRILFVILLGAYTAIGTNLMEWNWMHYPLKFSLQMAADTLLASALLGVTLGILVRPGADAGGDDIEYEPTPE